MPVGNAMRRLFSWFVVGFLVLGVGCRKPVDGPERPDLSQRPAKVFATTGMIADAVTNIGRDHVQVDCLMGPGVDPHRYLPTPADQTRLDQADLVLYNGLHLEGKMSDLFAARAKSKRTLAVAEGLPNLRDADVDMEGQHDPHVWFDVQMWMKVVERIRDALIDLDPAHAHDYRTNASNYLLQLNSLDTEVKKKIAQIPTAKRVLVTAHDAFGYFGRAYGMEVRGLQGVSTASDTGLRNVQDLAKVIGEKRIKTLFAETSVSDKGLHAVLQAVKQNFKGFEVQLAPDPLYSDALGEADSPGATYIGMVRHNVNIIVQGLAD